MPHLTEPKSGAHIISGSAGATPRFALRHPRAFGFGTLIVGFLAALAGPSLSHDAQTVRVLDGDSIRINSTDIRLWGIDAPEWDRPGGQRAKAVLTALVANGGRLTCQPLYKDRYGRDVSRCFTEDGRDLACETIKTGSARDYPRYSKGYYRPCER